MSLVHPKANDVELYNSMVTKVTKEEFNDHLKEIRKLRRDGGSNAACYRLAGLELKYTTADVARICATVFHKSIHYQAVRQVLQTGAAMPTKADQLKSANARIAELEALLKG